MALDDHAHPWIGSAFRHVSQDRDRDPLDFRWAGISADNRWNSPGQPTLYLAGDEGVLITEWGRYFQQAPAQAERRFQGRRVLRFQLVLDHVIDLREMTVWHELSLENAPTCFLNVPVARVTSYFIRTTSKAQGIIVPPVGLLDRPDRWNLVLFLEKLPDPSKFITSVKEIGELRRE